MLRCDETGTTIACKKSAVAEEAPFALCFARWRRPHHRIKCVIGLVRQRRERADVEVTLPVVLEGGERRVLAKNVGRSAVAECGAEAEALRHLADDPPVGPRLARRRQERTLTRDAALRIGDRAVLLAPRGGRQQHLRPRLDRVIAKNILGHDEQLELLQRSTHRARARQRDRRIGRHDPQRLDCPALDAFEHIDGLQTFAGHHAWCSPKAADAIPLGE